MDLGLGAYEVLCGYEGLHEAVAFSFHLSVLWEELSLGAPATEAITAHLFSRKGFVDGIVEGVRWTCRGSSHISCIRMPLIWLEQFGRIHVLAYVPRYQLKVRAFRRIWCLSQTFIQSLKRPEPLLSPSPVGIALKD